MMKYGTICYLTSGGKTLMIDKVERENDPNSGMIVAPGGHIEPGEGICGSVIREFEDESGLFVLDPKIRGTILFDNRDRTFDSYDNRNDFFVYVFSASRYSGNLIDSSKDGVPRWIDNYKMENVNSRESDKKLWELVCGKKNFSAVFRHKGEKMDWENCLILDF